MLSDDVRRTVADALRDAEVERAPIPPLRETWPDIDVVDAYEIQLLNIRRRLEAGARVNGHKVGLSSKAMQEMMGVDEPDYGHLLSDMEVSSDEPVPADRYCYPRVEVEVGFILGETLPGEGCTEDDVIRATRVRRPGDRADRQPDPRLEHQDRRHHRRQRLVGRLHPRPRAGPSRGRRPEGDRGGADPQRREGRRGPLATPCSATRSPRSPGSPTRSPSFGVTLEAGHVILPGSVHRAIDVRPGDDFVADFHGFGSVHLSFT